MLSRQELDVLLGPSQTDVSNDNTTLVEDDHAAFSIVLATEALINALERGSHLENKGLGLTALRDKLNELRTALSEA